jgi:hypothetical protein
VPRLVLIRFGPRKPRIITPPTLHNALMVQRWWRPGARSKVVLALAVTSAALGGCSLLSSHDHSGEMIAVTADEVAAAMAEDRFYADYGGATLLVSGTVASITGAGGETLVTLATSNGTAVLCDIGSARLIPGGPVVVRSSEVERRDVGVMLDGCRIV